MSEGSLRGPFMGRPGRRWAVTKTTDDDQQRPKKRKVSRRVTAADLVGDGRVDLYAGF
jgi:hypothetical protein